MDDLLIAMLHFTKRNIQRTTGARFKSQYVVKLLKNVINQTAFHYSQKAACWR